ncbi:MAG: Gfo/Idh/MocA family oxidoreductase, partial [Deinococcota bacterium]
NDPDVDAIYIGTPHPMHADNAIMCLEAGKAVLCEKSFAVNASQARRMVDTARAKGCFLMEAMWTRFLPHMQELRKQLEAGVIGELKLLEADFGFAAKINPEHRLFNPDLGGGSLLDVGIYPLSFASWLLGVPTKVHGVAHLGETGVDEVMSAVLEHPGGAQSRIASAVTVQTPQTARLVGTEGYLTVGWPWYGIPRDNSHREHHLTITKHQSDAEEVITVPHTGHGYQYEAAEVGRCVREGLLESPTMPLAETIAIMEVMDTLRESWGLRYPQER